MGLFGIWTNKKPGIVGRFIWDLVYMCDFIWDVVSSSFWDDHKKAAARGKRRERSPQVLSTALGRWRARRRQARG